MGAFIEIGALVGIGALINKNTFEGGAYSEGGAYWKEGALSNHYGSFNDNFQTSLMLDCSSYSSTA